MKLKKRAYLLLYILVFSTLLLNITSALGIVPAKMEYNFEPGFEIAIPYNVFSPNPEIKISLNATGDLAEYVTFNKEYVIGQGNFIVTLKLPKEIEKPGKHTITISATEESEPEKSNEAAVSTRVIINGIIRIFVPYPGRYLEISLNANDANIGEPVDFSLFLNSEGKEDITITPRIDVLFDNETIETLFFGNTLLKSQEKTTLTTVLDTSYYNSGKYAARAVVDYGKLAESETKFRIGYLSINITNYTKQFQIGKLEKFDVEIESGWNDNIDGAYADVSLSNDSTKLVDFKTTSTSLNPWEKKIITGYFDTMNFTEGVYDANISLIYYGKETGKSTSKVVEIKFVNPPYEFEPYMIVIIVIVGIILLIVIILLIKKYLLKNAKKRK